MSRLARLLPGLLLVGVCATPVLANVLYEDTFYWVPNGVGPLTVDVVINPPVPPVNSWVKIQETVYDDAQGRVVLQNALPVSIHGPAIPPVPFNLYVYSITNLGYGNGPGVGGGNGISGHNIVNIANVPTLGIWGPNAAASWWNTPAGNQPFPANWEWDVDGNMNGADGDGIGITLGQTFDGMMVAVPDGTPHGIVPSWVHTWTGGGALEQPNAVQIDIVNGLVSGPVPEPATLVFLACAGLAMAGRRRMA